MTSSDWKPRERTEDSGSIASLDPDRLAGLRLPPFSQGNEVNEGANGSRDFSKALVHVLFDQHARHVSQCIHIFNYESVRHQSVLVGVKCIAHEVHPIVVKPPQKAGLSVGRLDSGARGRLHDTPPYRHLRQGCPTALGGR